MIRPSIFVDTIQQWESWVQPFVDGAVSKCQDLCDPLQNKTRCTPMDTARLVSMKYFQNLTQLSSTSNPNYWYCSKNCPHTSCDQQKMASDDLRYIHHRVLQYCHGNGTEWYQWLQTNILTWMHISSATKSLHLQVDDMIHCPMHYIHLECPTKTKARCFSNQTCAPSEMKSWTNNLESS